jgi:hypothetical protein
LKLGRPGGSIRGWNQAGLKKKQGKKKPCVTRLTFIFLLKQRRYDLKKKTNPVKT